MGSSNWSGDAYSNLKRDYSTKSTDKIFTSKTIKSDMSPLGLKVREARDSDVHPESLAIIINLDKTGSMGIIPENLVRDKLGTIMETLINHGIKDAAVLFNAIGDSSWQDYKDRTCDEIPLQVGQFESGTDELIKWLTSTVLDGGGGGQNKESYLLAWLVAGHHTSIDCFEKRGQKGILFTIGDEACWDKLTKEELIAVMGYKEPTEMTDIQLLADAQRMYHVFHIHVNEGSYRNDPAVLGYWKKMLGERLIMCEDYKQLAEIMATTVAMIHGIELDTITKSFDDKTAKGVKNALMHVNTSGGIAKRQKEGVIHL